jgi:hypothetical protein
MDTILGRCWPTADSHTRLVCSIPDPPASLRERQRTFTNLIRFRSPGSKRRTLCLEFQSTIPTSCHHLFRLGQLTSRENSFLISTWAGFSQVQVVAVLWARGSCDPITHLWVLSFVLVLSLRSSSYFQSICAGTVLLINSNFEASKQSDIRSYSACNVYNFGLLLSSVTNSSASTCVCYEPVNWFFILRIYCVPVVGLLQEQNFFSRIASS